MGDVEIYDNKKESILKHPQIVLNGKPYINPDDKNIKYHLVTPDPSIESDSENNDEAMVYNTNKSYVSDADESNISDDDFDGVLELDMYASFPLKLIKLEDKDVLKIPVGTSLEGPMDIIGGLKILHIAEGYSLSNCKIEVVGNDFNITVLDGLIGNTIDFSVI